MHRKRTEYHYNPVDLEKDVAVGIKLTFSNDGFSKPAEHSGNLLDETETDRHQRSVFKQSFTTEEQAHSNLYTLILTVKGERPMQPLFGTDLPYYLFEPLNDGLMQRIKSDLIEDIRFWLPYIIIVDMSVTYVHEPESETDAYNISIKLKYQVTHQGSEKEITIFVTQSGTKIT